MTRISLRLAGLETRAVPSAMTAPPATTPAQSAAATPPATPATGPATSPTTTPQTGATPPAAGTATPPAAGATQAPTHPLPPVHLTHALTGRGTGTFQLFRANPDTGAEVKFQGTATMAVLGGPVAVAGDLHVPGNVANPVTTGTVVLTTKGGSVTVALTSFRPAAGTAAPVWFRYKVTGGTGSFAGLHDSGSLRLDWVPAPAGKAGDPPAGAARGSFRLTA